METILLFEIINGDRDRYAYIEPDYLRPSNGAVRTCGPCYFGDVNKIGNLGYGDVRTWLTEEEFEAITQGSDDPDIYNGILERAESGDSEYIRMVEDTKEDAKDAWKRGYHLSDEDCEDILDAYQYSDEYYDESIISNVWDTKDDFVEDEGWVVLGGDEREIDIEYINVDAVSDKLLDMDEAFYLLPSGKIAYFNL